VDGVRPSAPGEPLTGVAAVLVGIAGASLVAVSTPGASSQSVPSAPEPPLTAGEVVDGLRLSAALGDGAGGGPSSLVYGDCAPAGDAGCAPPVEIQVWHACRRSLSLYRLLPHGLAGEPAVVRGVPALVFDGGRRLELQTGRSTVVVFADSPARAARVAGALRSRDGRIAPGGRLPAPEPGAVERVVDC
jgi:hypothetical protein